MKRLVSLLLTMLAFAFAAQPLSAQNPANCDPVSVSTLAWTSDFEGTDAQYLNCWISASTGYRNGNTYPHIEPTPSIAHGGNAALEVAFGDIVTALPAFVEDISTLELSFWAMCNNYSVGYPNSLEVGYITDPTVDSTFVPLDTFQTSSYIRIVKDFAELANLNLPATTRIAFRFVQGSSNNLTSWYLDDMQVNLIPSCAAPVYNSVTVSNVTDQTAEVAFTDNNSSHNAWVIYYRPVNSTENYLTQNATTTTGATLSNLSANTTYTAFVKTVCSGAEGENQTDAVTFTTTTTPALLPYTDDFEDENDMMWVMVNGTQNNKWYVGTPTDGTSDVNTTVGGSRGLYISNNNGASNTYSYLNYQSSRVYAYRDILVPDGTTEMMLSFDWKAYGRSQSSEFLRVYWIDPEVVTLTAGNNPPTINGVNYDAAAQPGNYGSDGSEHWLSRENTWQHAEMVISSAQFQGMGNGDKVYRLVFHWRDAFTFYGGASNPPAAVDNVELHSLDCTAPTQLAVSDIDESSATISWNGNASSYSVVITQGTNESYQEVYDTIVYLSNLVSSSLTTVMVRSLCGGDSSVVTSISFNTTCGAIALTDDNPWFEDFESYTGGGEQSFICWDTPVTTPNGGPFVYCGYAQSCHSGSNSTELKGASNMLVMPPFSNDIHDLRLSFWATAVTPTNGTLEIGVLPDINDLTSFELLTTAGTPGPRGTQDGVTGNGAFMGPYDFNTVQATSGRIAFRYTSSGTNNSWNLDDFTVSLIPSCPEPTGLANVTISATEATITWNELNGNVYDVLYWSAGSNDTLIIPSVFLTDSIYTLGNLTPNTDYGWYVRTDCGGGAYANAFQTVTIHTPTLPVELPYERTFEEDSTLITEFTFQGTGSNQWAIGTATFKPSDPTDSTETGHSLYISNNNGISNSYTVSDVSDAYAIFNVAFDTPMEYHLSFDYKTQGESGYDEFSVYLVNADVTIPTSGAPSGTVLLSPQYNVADWTHVDYILNNVVGTSKKVVFYWRNDYSVGTNPPAAIDNIAVTGNVCGTPSNLSVSNLTAESATLSWEETGSATSWTVYWKESGSTGDYTNTVVNGTPSLDLSSLNANTEYQFYVVANCGSEGSDPSLTFSFFTTTVPAQLPLNENFENPNDMMWVFVNGTQTNQWFVGTPTDSTSDVNTTSGGTRGLYISNDNGLSNTYSYAGYLSSSRVYAYRDILVPDGTTDLLLSFDWKAYGRSLNEEFLRVYWMDPDVVTLTAGGNPPTVNGVNYDLVAQPGNYGSDGTEHWLARENTWQHAEMVISADQFAGMGNGDKTYRLVFHWRDAFSFFGSAANPPAAVDNVTLRVLDCIAPTQLTVSNVDQSSATLAWSGHADSYSVLVTQGATTTYLVVADTTVTLTNLMSSTPATVAVRALCNGDSSFTANTSFTTSCGAITVTSAVPWFEDFEGYAGNGEQPFLCWDTPVTDATYNAPFVYCGHSPACHSGQNSAELKGSTNLLVLPEFTNNIHELRLTFWATATTTSIGTLQVGVITDLTNPNSFELVDNAGTPGPRGDYGGGAGNGNFMGPFDFNGVQAANGRIALRYTSNSPNQSWNLDDITVALAPNCLSPVKTSVTATNIDGHHATISFIDNDPNHNSWTVYYKPSSDAIWSQMVTNTTSAVLSNLDPETDYDVYVVTNCAVQDDVEDATLTIHFTTTIACPQPTNVTITTSSTEAFVSWDGTADNYILSCNGVTTTVSGNSATITGLTPAMPYTLSLTADCGLDGSSDAVVAFFTTACDVVAAFPYVESFESGLGCWISSVVSGSSNWTINSTYNSSPNAPDGSNFAYVSSTTYGHVTTLTSPLFDLTGLTNPYLSFYHIQQKWVSDQDKLYVYYKTSPTATPVLLVSFTNNITSWQLDSVALPSPSAEYQIIFEGHEEYGYGVGLDQVRVYGDNVVEPCDVPTGLHTTDVQNESIAIAWDDNANANGWNIRYSTQDGAWITATSSTNSYTITGLTGLTTYVIQVQADCGDGQVSGWSTTLNETTTNVGIENWLEKSVTLYPNPATEMVNVEISDANIMITGVEMYNVYGQIVEAFHGTSLQGRATLNVSGLADGMYYVRVTTDSGVVTKNFVKR
ncbi:MAG: fibronectin type III domain-containing protein [Bacteroidales bacterium]|nr:fibronectin type III domain-containing protein [Bacteroidales bacterium]